MLWPLVALTLAETTPATKALEVTRPANGEHSMLFLTEKLLERCWVQARLNR